MNLSKPDAGVIEEEGYIGFLIFQRRPVEEIREGTREVMTLLKTDSDVRNKKRI